jgi:hypothetical protein
MPEASCGVGRLRHGWYGDCYTRAGGSHPPTAGERVEIQPCFENVPAKPGRSASSGRDETGWPVASRNY